MERLQAFFDGSQSNGKHPPEPEDGEKARLYACRECETTYISTGMQSCPECGDRVDTVPNERELGLE